MQPRWAGPNILFLKVAGFTQDMGDRIISNLVVLILEYEQDIYLLSLFQSLFSANAIIDDFLHVIIHLIDLITSFTPPCQGHIN